MVRRSSCGKTAETWLTFAMSTCLEPREDVGAVGDVGLLRYQRMAKKPTRATAMICGMLIDVWPAASAMVNVYRYRAAVSRLRYRWCDVGCCVSRGVSLSLAAWWS